MIEGLKGMTLVAVIPFIAVLIAMSVDLGSGLYKARLRNEVTTSYGLHRTVIKFISYEGSLLVAFSIDVMLHFTHLWEIVSLNPLFGVPVLTILLGSFSCFIELMSIREKASRKADKRAMSQLVAIVKTLSGDEVRNLLTMMGKIKDGEDIDDEDD